MEEIRSAIEDVVKKLFDVDVSVELTRPDEQFGDYATNVALKLGKELNKNPRELAETIAKDLNHPSITKVKVAGPGFINIQVNNKVLWELASLKPVPQLTGKEILVEFGDPNPFKEMHLGHLYTSIVGDVISNLLEANGATVRRLSYHGDVGMHVAKAIWALIEHLKKKDKVQSYTDDTVLDVSSFNTIFGTTLGIFYAQGAAAFEASEEVASQIKDINEHIYKKDNELINALHKWGTAQSFSYFDQIFEELGIKYEPNGRYLESAATEAGIKLVKQNLGKVFEESQGAVIYPGEKAGLHTRVFINSRGLPTYEAKDLGLVQLKHQDYPTATQSIIITAHEQSEYFKVMLAALKEIEPALAEKTQHIAHGFLTLTTGKMSSRTGEVQSASNLMVEVEKAAQTAYPDSDVQRDVYLAALKYTFLKNRIGGDIVFNVQESVSLEGNSGPYLQYAHVRARSIIAKAQQSSMPTPMHNTELNESERNLLRKIGEYSEVVEKAVAELMPHHISIYLYELAQTFNRFYEENRVIGHEQEIARISLVGYYVETLKNGLKLLNIPAPERM